MGCSRSSSKREAHNYTSLLLQTGKIPNKQSNFAHKGTRKRVQTKPKVSRRKEIIKFRAEINESKKNTKDW